MRGSVLFIAVLLAAITPVATDAFSQDGYVTGAQFDQLCANPTYVVYWSGVWWDVQEEVAGACQPDYGFGSIEALIVEVDPDVLNVMQPYYPVFVASWASLC